jgi:hypothetical protein
MISWLFMIAEVATEKQGGEAYPGIPGLCKGEVPRVEKVEVI